MSEKQNILESWIMVEKLSDGDINDKDKSIFRFDTPENNDYYSFFCREIAGNKICQGKNGGIAVYFDIFSFNEVVDLLRKQFDLKPTNEEIPTGNKFSFALYFDKELNFQPDMTFFTASAYIRYFHEIPHENDFTLFEERFKDKLIQAFDESSENAEKFNAAVSGLLKEYNISVESCRLQFVRNLETDATNLHSFFVEDLEKAKDIDTENLNDYLNGNTADRVNLDSKKDSRNFAPKVFEEILQPENYPLGRFPGNTKFALSFMQQVAVNLATGYDDRTIRSVNGPPGTGKTTLLKDIFAELIVQQSYDIANLTKRFIEGTEETVYFNNASIGKMPEHIAENNIVVASSNNGAVQNIVNELPITQGQIDDALVEELKKADYFRKAANSKVSTSWEKGDDGRSHEILNVEPNEEEDVFWGLFSLEGGKSANMNNIIANIRCVLKYFDEDYIPDSNVYAEFLNQYHEVEKLRKRAQDHSDNIGKYQQSCRELSKLRADFNSASASKRAILNDQLNEMSGELDKVSEELGQLGLRLEENKAKQAESKDRFNAVLQYERAIQSQKPGLFASKAQKEEYKNKQRDVSEKLREALEEQKQYTAQEQQIQTRIAQLKIESKLRSEKLSNLQQEYNTWENQAKANIEQLEQKVNSFAGSNSDIAPLDMTLDYDKLQLSNPWFDENYRIAQSRLFIKALVVRKQFLYENRKNVKAAVNIWKNQKRYLEKIHIIEFAWDWINLTVPIISSTFASFSRMCKYLRENSMGHLFVDEAGQAVPQASVGAIFRSRYVMVVGDPSQIKPVLTLDSSVLGLLSKHFNVTEKYLSDSASTQTLVDDASRYGFYREQDMSPESWIGIPLWVHRRCEYPMFTISNLISYNGYMVQGKPGNGKTGWFDVGGRAINKYVDKQGDFLVHKISEMIKQDPGIIDKSKKDTIYVISPFSNVAYQLSQKLKSIGFTRYDENRKPTNVGTIHTFQGKEAPIVFMVLGADKQSSGAARWAVSEPNMMNVAATRAKKEFYVIGDKELYLGLGSDVATDTFKIIKQYKDQHPDLVDDDVTAFTKTLAKKENDPPAQTEPPAAAAGTQANGAASLAEEFSNTAAANTASANTASANTRVQGKVTYVGNGKSTKYAYVNGNNGKKYTINEAIYAATDNAGEVIQKGKSISFVPKQTDGRWFATDVKPG